MQGTTHKLNNAGVPLRRSVGFSLFELVVYIIAVAIIYATAANRFAEFPAAAERANFMAITAQLQSAINLEMLLGVGNARPEAAAQMAGMNPMEFLLETPSNYLGAFDQVDKARLDRRIWYFDRQSGELVYLIDGASRVFLLLNGNELPTDELRFKIVADYGDYDADTGLLLIAQNSGEAIQTERDVVKKFGGVVLRPVFPFHWARQEQGELIDDATD